jgi:hypothetical protein
MALDEHTRQRIRGIATGSIPPETGMERHFRRVCLGEANPLTAEEREWYEFLQQGEQGQPRAGSAMEELRREREARTRAEAAQRVAERRNRELELQLANFEAQEAERHFERAAAQKQAEALRQANEGLRSVQSAMDRVSQRLQLRELEARVLLSVATQKMDLRRSGIVTNEAETSRLNANDSRAIEEFGYLRELADKGLIPEETFEELAQRSGLAIALHNLDKIRRVMREGVPIPGGTKDISALVRESRCNACDRPLSFCICGR